MSEHEEMTTHVPESWNVSDARRAQLKTHYDLRALGERKRRRIKTIMAAITGVLVVVALFGFIFGTDATRLGILYLIIIVGAGSLWLLPGLIADSRGHRNSTAIWIITLFLGWTLVGWVVAMAWAVYEEKK